MTSWRPSPGPSSPLPPARGRPRGRRLWVSLIVLAGLVALAVAADFVTKHIAQDKIASDIQRQGFPAKPSVTIEGFPFLTQVLGHDIRQIQVSARDVPEGPLRIARVSAVMTGIRLSSGFSGGTVDNLSGSLLVTFPALARAITSQIGALGSVVGSAGLTLSAAGRHEVTTSLNLVVVSGSATWRVTRLNGRELGVALVASSGLPSSLLGSVRNFTIGIPRLPLGVKIDSVTVTPAGVGGSFSGHHLPFGSGAPGAGRAAAATR